MLLRYDCRRNHLFLYFMTTRVPMRAPGYPGTYASTEGNWVPTRVLRVPGYLHEYGGYPGT